MLYIKGIWDELYFIKNKVKRVSQLKGSIWNISERDFGVIQEYIKKIHKTIFFS